MNRFAISGNEKIRRLLLVIWILALFNGTGVAVCSSQTTPNSFADLAQNVAHSVVNISSTQTVEGMQSMPWRGSQGPFEEFFERFFGDLPQRARKTRALGSGFIIDKDGHIFTNNHVVEKATEITVVLQNGQEYPAKIVGRDPKTELALIKITAEAKDLPNAAELGDSDKIRVGDWVLAVGNPFGLGHTVTAGIIGAKSRIIGAGPYDDFLQTDAAINPGNSGGPLFNSEGKVVGINTAIVAEGQGIGFAIPINLAKELLPQLMTGKITRGYLGISIQDVTPQLAETFGLKEDKGVLVAQVVEGSPAQKAGLKEGDIILAVNGKTIETAHALSSTIAGMAPGTAVELRILRDGTEKTVSADLGTMPGTEVSQEAASEREPPQWGLSVQEITPELARRLNLDADQGVIIVQVQPGSPAAEAVLQQGDIIREVARKQIANLQDFRQAIDGAKGEDQLLFRIQRNDGFFYSVLESNNKNN